MASVTIRVECWDGSMKFARSPHAAIKSAIELWEKAQGHPGRPWINFYVGDVLAETVTSLPALRRALEKKGARP